MMRYAKKQESKTHILGKWQATKTISDQMPDYEHYKHMEPKETMFKENPKELSKKTIRTNKLVQ